jgi:ribonucleotide monophosphatase NagD (HAD superfamily)
LLNRAFRLIHERRARLVGLGRTRYWKAPVGLQLDVGPFLAALEYATGNAALVFAKPEPAFFAALIQDVGEPADSVAMIGDDIVSDVGGAMNAGLRGVLVRRASTTRAIARDRFSRMSSPIRLSTSSRGEAYFSSFQTTCTFDCNAIGIGCM